MTYQLFIFDFDGTLADSGPWMAKAFNAAAAKFGFRQLSDDEIEAMRGRDNRTLLKEIGVPMWKLPAIARYVRALAANEPAPPLFPGVPEMLRAIDVSGATIAVVTSNSEATVRRALGDDLAVLIDLYACEASLFGKAAKFRRVLRETRIASQNAVAVGDETRDIEAARKAAIACASVTWGYATPALLQAHKPDFLVDAPAALAALSTSPR